MEPSRKQTAIEGFCDFNANKVRSIEEGLIRLKKLLGIIFGAIITYQDQHMFVAHAFGYTNANPLNRIASVAFGVIILLCFMEIFRRFFGPSFFHGFMVSAGLFLSLDIVLFHWIFKLHRITSGPEANVLEPIFVVVGMLFIWQGISRERKLKVETSRNHSISRSNV